MNMHVSKTALPTTNDPIVKLIDECRAARRAFEEAHDADGEGPPNDDPLSIANSETLEAVYDTAPLTLEGAAAKIEFIKQVERESMGYMPPERLYEVLGRLLPLASPSPDAELIALGSELQTARDAERKSEGDADLEAQYQRCHAIVAKIEKITAHTFAGLKVKALAVSWCDSGEPLDGMFELYDSPPSTDIRLTLSIFNDLLGAP